MKSKCNPMLSFISIIYFSTIMSGCAGTDVKTVEQKAVDIVNSVCSAIPTATGVSLVVEHEVKADQNTQDTTRKVSQAVTQSCLVINSMTIPKTDTVIKSVAPSTPNAVNNLTVTPVIK